MTREKLLELWDAAAAHCMIMCGETLSNEEPEFDENENEIMPLDDDDAINCIIQYLKESV